MAIATFKQDGGMIDIVAGSNGISATEVYVSGNLIGVANVDIPANTQGAIQVFGVYDIAKASAEVFTIGAEVWYNTTSKCCYASSGTDCVKFGIAVAAASSGATEVKALLK